MYITGNKYLDGIGYIAELETFEEIIEAQVAINAKASVLPQDVITSLGLTKDEIPVNDTNILGYPVKHWNDDIKRRINELRDEIKLDKLQKAKITLEKYLSDDDKFNLETADIELLLTDESDNDFS